MKLILLQFFNVSSMTHTIPLGHWLPSGGTVKFSLPACSSMLLMCSEKVTKGQTSFQVWVFCIQICNGGAPTLLTFLHWYLTMPHIFQITDLVKAPLDSKFFMQPISCNFWFLVFDSSISFGPHSRLLSCLEVDYSNTKSLSRLHSFMIVDYVLCTFDYLDSFFVRNDSSC